MPIPRLTALQMPGVSVLLKGHFGFVAKDELGDTHVFDIAPELIPRVSDLWHSTVRKHNSTAQTRQVAHQQAGLSSAVATPAINQSVGTQQKIGPPLQIGKCFWLQPIFRGREMTVTHALAVWHTILLTFFLGAPAIAANVEPCRNASTGKYGLCSGQGGVGPVSVEQRFDRIVGSAAPFAARLSKDGKFGYIDASGKWMIAPQYDSATWFSEAVGLAAVTKGDLSAAINSRGDVVIPWFKGVLGPFVHGIAAYVPDVGPSLEQVKQGKLGFMDARGKVIIPAKFDVSSDLRDVPPVPSNGYLTVSSERAWGVINLAGQWVVNPEYDWANLTALRPGFTVVTLEKRTDEGWSTYSVQRFEAELTGNGRLQRPIVRSVGRAETRTKTSEPMRFLLPYWQRERLERAGVPHQYRAALAIGAIGIGLLVSASLMVSLRKRMRWPARTALAVASGILSYGALSMVAGAVYYIVATAVFLAFVLILLNPTGVGAVLERRD